RPPKKTNRRPSKMLPYLSRGAKAESHLIGISLSIKWQVGLCPGLAGMWATTAGYPGGDLGHRFYGRDRQREALFWDRIRITLSPAMRPRIPAGGALQIPGLARRPTRRFDVNLTHDRERRCKSATMPANHGRVR